MTYKDEHSRNKEALDLMVKMRTGNGGAAKVTPSSGANPLVGLLMIVAIGLPIGVLSGVIPKSAVAGIPLLGDLPGVQTSVRPASNHAASTKGYKSVKKHGKRKAGLHISHQATGRVLNAE